MSRYNDQVGLRDMLSHAQEAADLLRSSSKEDFGANRARLLLPKVPSHDYSR